MSNAKWRKKTLRLKDDHQWKATPGYNVFVADRGAVRFDFPQDWVVIPGEDSIRFYDKQPPDDDCLLQVSVTRINPQIDLTGLPMGELLEVATSGDERQILSYGEMVQVRRPDLELAWREGTFIDPNEQRLAHTRACMARAGGILPLITFEFWADDLERLDPVWNEVLRSLRLGQFVKDPRRGARYGYG